MTEQPEQNINKTQTGKRVLVAPLDWGLGHASRCIPIITELLSAKFEVWLAAEGKTAALLQEKFPELPMLSLGGYRVRYARSSRCFFSKMLLQFPRIRKVVRREHRWLEDVIGKHRIDVVISDNRFGLYSKHATTIFITHQLAIKTGRAWADRLAQRINYRHIQRFDQCWVPDLAGADNLAGELSHPTSMPTVPVKYIGACSRFTRQPGTGKLDVLALVSGPEPQRSVFETALTKILEKFRGTALLLRGLPGQIEAQTDFGNLTIKNHLPDSGLNSAIASAQQIVARSGYSTIMDLAACGKSAILIPTPGQTEQEYLAKYLSDKGLFTAATIESLDLNSTVAAINPSKFEHFFSPSLLRAAIKSL